MAPQVTRTSLLGVDGEAVDRALLAAMASRRRAMPSRRV